MRISDLLKLIKGFINSLFNFLIPGRRIKRGVGLYHLVVILKPTLTKEEIYTWAEAQCERNQSLDEQLVGFLFDASLAYPIEDFTTGHVVEFYFTGNGKMIDAIDVALQQDGTVLYSIIIKVYPINTS